MEKRHDEFAALMRESTRLLMDETPPSNLPQSSCELLVSIQPAFVNWTTWALFAVGQSDDLLVRRIIWHRVSDQGRFFDPLQGLKFGWHTTPTTTVRVAKLPRTELAELFKLGRAINKEPDERRGIMLDGERWFLKWHGAFGDQLLSWHRLSAEHEDLALWTGRVVGVLEKAFQVSNGVNPEQID